MRIHTQLSDIGIVGLGTMGSALAKNIASRGYRVSVYNRDAKKTKQLLREASSEQFFGAKTYRAFTASIARPRKIVIMVTAGAAVDAVVRSLLPHLSKGDSIIDGGNSQYRDTERRFVELKKKGFEYVGCGISGGPEGALRGPSLMLGGTKRAWRSLRPIFESIAARDFSGKPCAAYFGKQGAGHYVKMVHNGIEYGLMQLIAEAYMLLRVVYKLPAEDIAEIFARYNRGKLQSFLLEIAVPVLSKECEPNNDSACLMYYILDKASQKGTGAWASIDAIERGVALPTITDAVYARFISGEKAIRSLLNTQYRHKHAMKKMPLAEFTRMLGDALYAGTISTFAQGFTLLARASKEEAWNIDLAEVARVWQGGCIVRAKLLGAVADDFKKHRVDHLLLLPRVEEAVKKNIKKLRDLVSSATASGVSLPGFSSSLYYVESMTERTLPANVIQGLRDYFGAHGYQRTDTPGIFHTNWKK